VAYFKGHPEYDDMGLVEDQVAGMDDIFGEFKPTKALQPQAQAQGQTQAQAQAPPSPARSTTSSTGVQTKRGSRKGIAKKGPPRFNGWTMYLTHEIHMKKHVGMKSTERMKIISDVWKAMPEAEKDIWKERALEKNRELASAASATTKA